MSKKKKTNKVDVNIFGINISADLDEVIGNFCNMDAYKQKVTENQRKVIESKEVDEDDCED